MRYDDDNLLDNEDDIDLWDDELELSDQPYSRPDNSTYENVQPRTSDDEPYDYYSDPASEASEQRPEARDQRPASSDVSDMSDPSDSSDHDDEDSEDEDDDDDDNDYFDDNDYPVKTKQKKAPKLDPEDPDYWIGEEESPLSEIIHKPKNKWKWWLASAVALLIFILFSWIWFLRPHTDNAVKYGYIINMERRGSLVKTFEGTMVPYKELGDPHPLRFEKVGFSVESDSLAAVMKRFMLRCVPVRVEYKEYHAPLPWKGEAPLIIVNADSADPHKILPPEFRK